MRLGFLTKLFHLDSVPDPQLDTGTLAKIKQSWQEDIVSGDSDDPSLSDKERGVDIISEEIKQHGRKMGGAWRSTTKGRGDK